MEYLPVTEALSMFVDIIQKGRVPITTVHMTGSLARQEADRTSDLDMVIVLQPQHSLSELAESVPVIDDGVCVIREHLLASGNRTLKVSVPKIVRSDDWQSKHWLQPFQFGMMARLSPTLMGEQLCASLEMPSGRILRHDALTSLSLRLYRFLFQLSLEWFYRPQPMMELRTKHPSWLLRTAIWLDTGVYLRSADSVFVTAAKLYNSAPISELARQIQDGNRFRFQISREMALALGETFISLFRRFTSQESHEPVPPLSYPGTNLPSPLIQEFGDYRAPSAIRTLYTRLEQDDHICVLVPVDELAWSQAMMAAPPPPATTDARLQVVPLDLFQQYIRHTCPLELSLIQADLAADRLATSLGLMTDSFSRNYAALRWVGYFRYNALNKLADFHQAADRIISAQRTRPRLIRILTALQQLRTLGLEVSEAQSQIIDFLDHASEPKSYDQLKNAWISLVDSIPSIAAYLTAERRAELDPTSR